MKRVYIGKENIVYFRAGAIMTHLLLLEEAGGPPPMITLVPAPTETESNRKNGAVSEWQC